METRDWSLVIFTVLTQAAVGAFLTLQVLEHLATRRDRGASGRATDGPQNNSPARGGAQADEHEAGSARESSGARALAARGPLPAPLLVVLAVLSVGLFAALFHLSTPLQAVRAVVNFSSSWLSREIVFGSLFAALLSALVWHEWRTAGAAAASPAPERHAAGSAASGSAPATPTPAGQAFRSPAPANALSADPTSLAPATWLPRFTAAAGLAFICCQIAIYLLPAQPAWNSFATPAAFGGTALRLGILGVAAGFAVRNLTAGVDDPAPADPGGSGVAPAATLREGKVIRSFRVSDGGSGVAPAATLRGLALAGIAALALEFVVVPLHLSSLSANPLPAAAASVQRLTVDYSGILLLRLGLLGAAAAALVGVLVTIRRAAGPSAPSPPSLASVLTCVAFGLTVASEVCGRFLFYAMQVRVGI